MGLANYVRSAFLNRWNMLLFLGGCAFAALSGRPDVVAPIVLAAEVGYLGMLGTHPKFQKYVDAQQAASLRKQSSQTAEQTLQQILRSLAQPAMVRFERLRARCHELRQIASDLKQSSTHDMISAPLDSLHLEGLDRLLWIFLRMLYTQQALTRFLERTSTERIQADIQSVESRLKNMAPDATPHGQKVRRALEDNLQTSKDRFANYQKARSNLELLDLELDRLENKIKSLAELAVNRQEPDFISGQVDQVAHSMLETEKTMNELRFATGLELADQEAPELLRYPPVQIIE